jgi:ABC-type enterochelin transport system ATPase subunit
MSPSTTRNQCYYDCRVPGQGHASGVPFSMIGRILGADKGTVKQHYKRHLDQPEDELCFGRLSILTELQHEELVHEIELANAHGRPMTMDSIQEYLQTHVHSSMNKIILAHLFERNTRAKSCPGIHMETARLQMMRDHYMSTEILEAR